MFQVLDGLDLIVQSGLLQEKVIFHLLVHHTITLLTLLKDLVINVKQSFFENTVTRIFESPRVTKPYKDEQWEAIYNLGFKVDEDLVKNDVRLTMGGEPTFVSIDDMESAQWNSEADGEHKRELANNLSRRLLETNTNGGLLHHAQGKWYPGEPLTRWQTTVFGEKIKTCLEKSRFIS